MANEKHEGLDVLGLKPFAKSVEIVTQASTDAATALFERICLPAAKEFGLLIKEKVHTWRAGNVVKTAHRAEEKMKENAVGTNAHVHPKMLHTIIESSSWVDDAVVQDMWAGLLSASCTETGDDDSNLIFTDLLARLTKVQARILRYACENAPKRGVQSGLIFASEFLVDLHILFTIAAESDLHRLDRELGHLRATGLLGENSGIYRNRPVKTPCGGW